LAERFDLSVFCYLWIRGGSFGIRSNETKIIKLKQQGKMNLYKVKEIENFSGVNISKLHNKIKPLRKGYYQVLNISVGGDAPKDFIRVYQYGQGMKKNVKDWPKFIAKVGHKWYPIESITEYLHNRIGEILGLNMAESELRLVDEQIRFLSKYFLKEDETLVHGAQIFSGYLEESDDAFVTEIEKKGLTRELLTFQVTSAAIILGCNRFCAFTFRSPLSPD
jgi:hypothetical protein